VSRRYGCRNISSSEAARRFAQSRADRGQPVAADHSDVQGTLTISDANGLNVVLNVPRRPDWVGVDRGEEPSREVVSLVRLGSSGVHGANPDSVRFDSSPPPPTRRPLRGVAALMVLATLVIE
jgi:hypothetical protein